MNRSETFEYDGRTLEVRAALVGAEWRVQVFENGKPANQVAYSVSGLTELDARMNKGVDSVASLIEVAQRDFVTSSDWLKRNSAA